MKDYTFSKGFMNDLREMLILCDKNDTTHIDLEFNINGTMLDVGMTFLVREEGKQCHGKSMTNADKIRSMSDEELAEHFSKLIKDTHEIEYCEDFNDWLKWLQTEVEE